MQISRIYSNRAGILEAVDFNFGTRASRLNVVLGEIRKPQDLKSDSHNLGKTTLLHMVDFLLLSGLGPDHFLVVHESRFKDFDFYLEIALNAGEFATVRRNPSNPGRIGLTRHGESGQDFTAASEDAWDHPDLSLEEARTLLDAWLDLRVLRPFDYRKAITYFLRSQGDWRDELQLEKFKIGRDLYWKPFIAHLFGFKEGPIVRKYELDEAIQQLRKRQAEQQAEVQFKENDLPEVVANIAVLRQQVATLEEQLDAFQFDAEERRLVRDLVETVEQDIANLNQLIYNLRYDIRQIDNSLNHKDRFDLEEVEAIFKEASVYFSDQIRRPYSDLVEFKRKVTRERNSSLRSRRKSLDEQREAAEKEKANLDARRTAQLYILRNTDTFDKFKALQKELSRQQAELVYLDEQRKKLDAVADTARQVRESERERGRVVDEIKAMIARPSAVYERFSAVFNNYCQRVMDHEGLFYFRVNNSDNLEYRVGLGLAGQKGKQSSQGEGTSYKKLVCALFDLALLKVYEDARFFHFAYHDGMFEGLDDRKKLAFLSVLREQTATGKLQYILTAIASDLPRNADDEVVNFDNDEVVLRLHDEGIQGRLFKMGEF